MAALYADVGKSTDDFIKNVFPPVSGGVATNNFETEVNAKSSSGSKLQVVVTKQKDGLVSNFKPTFPVSVGETKGEVKVQLGTDNKTKIDTSFALNAVAGLKVKLGTTDSNINGGFDYTSPSLSTNVKVDYAVKNANPTVEAASVFVRGNYAVGARVLYPVGAAQPEVEAKVQSSQDNSSILLNVNRDKTAKLSFGLNYFYRLSDTRNLATRVTFAPGAGSISENVDLTLVTSNQVNDTTLVKARFNSGRRSLAFGVSNALNNNLNLEFATEFPANLSAGSVYNVKLVYNN